MNLLKAKRCLIQLDCPFNYRCDAHIKFYPVMLDHSGIYMQIRHISVYTCTPNGWKNYSLRVNRNLYFLPHVMRMFKVMDMKRVENVLTIGERKEV